MNWKRWGILIAILGLFWVVQQYPDGKLHLVFCDVGQGDAALIVLGRFQALVDTGPDKEKVLGCVARHMPFWDRNIDLIFISHSQADHSGALKEIVKRYKVGRIIDKPSINDIVKYGNLQFDILSAIEASIADNVLGKTNENEDSVVVKMNYKGFSALFTGDIGESTELALVDMGVLEKVDLLKVAHHGSKYSSVETFLEKVRPEVAVVSVGEKNTYGHPNSDTLLRFDMLGTKVFRTDKNGEIELEIKDEKVSVFSKK